MNPPKNLQLLTIVGADGHPINPGDQVIATATQGILRWGTYAGVLETSRCNRKFYRFYMLDYDRDGNPTGYSYINGSPHSNLLTTSRMTRR